MAEGEVTLPITFFSITNYSSITVLYYRSTTNYYFWNVICFPWRVVLHSVKCMEHFRLLLEYYFSIPFFIFLDYRLISNDFPSCAAFKLCMQKWTRWTLVVGALEPFGLNVNENLNAKLRCDNFFVILSFTLLIFRFSLWHPLLSFCHSQQFFLSSYLLFFLASIIGYEFLRLIRYVICGNEAI